MSLCYEAGMRDDKPTLLEQRILDRDAYMKGLREGWSQAMWLVFVIVILIAVVLA